MFIEGAMKGVCCGIAPQRGKENNAREKSDRAAIVCAASPAESARKK